MDTFTYQAFDGELSSNIATVTIDVINHAPVAVDDSYATDRSVGITIDVPGVLTNDSDPDNDPLTAVLVEGPSEGTLEFDFTADGSISFTPAIDFHGDVTFTYKAVDSGGLGSNEATVTITVLPAVSEEVHVNTDTPKQITDRHWFWGPRLTAKRRHHLLVRQSQLCCVHVIG